MKVIRRSSPQMVEGSASGLMRSSVHFCPNRRRRAVLFRSTRTPLNFFAASFFAGRFTAINSPEDLLRFVQPLTPSIRSGTKSSHRRGNTEFEGLGAFGRESDAALRRTIELDKTYFFQSPRPRQLVLICGKMSSPRIKIFPFSVGPNQWHNFVCPVPA